MNIRKGLTTLLLTLGLVTVTASGETTITKVVVRDCDKQADTAIVVTDGQMIDPGTLPAHYTFDFLTSHAAAMFFSVDGSRDVEFDATPYCPIGHNTPLNWALGEHSVSVQVNTTGTPVEYTFTIAVSAKPATEQTSSFGTNGDGILSPGGDPSRHPQLLAACKTYNFQYFRLWTTGTFSTPFPASYWKIPLQYQAAGIRVLAVINFQNSIPRCSTPSDKDWLIKINSFPGAKASGVWGVCLGNEVDTPNYYTGTNQTLAHLMQLAYPILKSKGYVVIAPSYIKSMDNVKSLVSILGTAVAYDYLDYHVYEPSAAGALFKVDAYKAYCASINVQGLLSECGMRLTAANLAGWAQQQQLFFQGLKAKSGIYLQFPLYWLPTSIDPLCQQAPLGRDSAAVNEPFASAMKIITAN